MGVNFAKIGYLWRKLSKLGNFGCQNYVIDQNVLVGGKYVSKTISFRLINVSLDESVMTPFSKN